MARPERDNGFAFRSGDVGTPQWGVDLRLLEPFALRHHGVITITAADDAGVSRDAWHRAVRSGQVDGLFPGVARVVGSPRTREQRIVAAVLAAGPTALASHRSATYLWGAPRSASDPIDVIVARRSVSARLPGVVVHHPRDLAELRQVVRSGIPTTTPMRAVLDLGAVDRRSAVADAVSHLVTAKVVSPATLAAFLRRHEGRGRSGTVALRRALAVWTIDAQMADSTLEARFSRLLRRHHLPSATFHAMVAGYEVDFLLDGTNVVVECDGHASHGLDRDQFEFDRVRDADITAAGYLVVHVTWNTVVRNPRRVAQRLAAVIQRWGPEALRR